MGSDEKTEKPDKKQMFKREKENQRGMHTHISAEFRV
jgi:hypothetical protein